MPHHLTEGNWYKVEQSYDESVISELNQKYEDQSLIDYSHPNEGAYNQDVSDKNSSFICLDTTNIAPRGETAVEPCDLYLAENNLGIFYHVKRSTLSQKLSHLFNQGLVSIELIKLNASSKDKLINLIKSKLNGNKEDTYINPINKGSYKVAYGIVTHKDKTNKSKNLPLFSRISLLRCFRILELYEAESCFFFISDKSTKKKS